MQNETSNAVDTLAEIQSILEAVGSRSCYLIVDIEMCHFPPDGFFQCRSQSSSYIVGSKVLEKRFRSSLHDAIGRMEDSL